MNDYQLDQIAEDIARINKALSLILDEMQARKRNGGFNVPVESMRVQLSKDQ